MHMFNRDNKISSDMVINCSWYSHMVTLYDFMTHKDFFLNSTHSHAHLQLFYIISGCGTFSAEASSANVHEQTVSSEASSHNAHEQIVSAEASSANACEQTISAEASSHTVRNQMVSAGDLIFINKGVKHRLTSTEQHPLRAILSTFDISGYTSYAAQKSTSEVLKDYIMAEENALIDTLLQKETSIVRDNGSCALYAKAAHSGILSNRMGEHIIVKNDISNYILSAVQQLSGTGTRPVNEKSNTEPPYLSGSQIIAYIQTRFMEDISLSSTAAYFNYSERQFQRILKDMVGVTFSDLLTDIRLSNAKLLLSSTKYSIDRIAAMCGLNDRRKLTGLFKKRFGTTPSAYRRLGN